MRALGVRTFGKPDTYEILRVPIPEISGRDDIIVKIKAIRLNTGDGLRAAGYSRIVETPTLPFIIGHDYAGVISAIGDNVKNFAVGDAVYGLTLGPRAAAEYVLITPKIIHSMAHKPEYMSFADAACFTAIAHTIVQTLLRADSEIEGGLKGKTALVPAGLSGTGSLALQLLKSVFGVGKLITTVSTAKVALLPELIGEGAVDQIIDYKTQKPVKEIKSQSVDFLLDTSFTAMSFLPVMKPKTGLILTITGKSGDHMAHDWPATPWLFLKFANAMDAMYRWRAWRWGVKYDHVFVVPAGKDLDMLAEWYKEKKVKAIIGEKLKMEDLENVRRVGGMMFAGKGGIGNYVIEID